MFPSQQGKKRILPQAKLQKNKSQLKKKNNAMHFVVPVQLFGSEIFVK